MAPRNSAHQDLAWGHPSIAGQATVCQRAIAWTLVVLSVVCLMACDHPTSPTSTPADPNAPVAGAHSGPVGIEFQDANIAPGSTIAGCGPTLAGCAGRLRLSFRLRSAGAGPVLFTSATLHGANKVACLTAMGDGFSLAANATVTVNLVFDRVDLFCGLPLEVVTLAMNIEGTGDVESRQEFDIRYRFTP